MSSPPVSIENGDPRVDSRMQNYAGYWQQNTLKDSKVDLANRVTNYTEVINGYYDGATELYEYGWSQSFHFCRFFKGEGFYQALARHEHYLAAQMQLRPGMRVLDVGCGVGGPAREIAGFADVHIVGVNNNEFQVRRARKYTTRQGLDGQVTYVKGDFMKLAEQFGEDSFDAVYAIEATVHAPSFEGIYEQIKKVLKPGGIFGVYEWCMTDAWDPSIPSHKDLVHRIELGNGIPQMRTVSDSLSALEKVGFEILHKEDLAERPDPVKWYYPLEGDIRKAQTPWDLITCWRLSWSGKLITHNGLWMLEKLGIAPKGTYGVGKTLLVAQDALVEGGQRKLFTPMLLVISRKPEA